MKQSLVVLICLCVLTWTVSGAPNSIKKNCCLKYSPRIPRIGKIRKHRIQESNGLCKFDAVVFFTKRGPICSDPNDEKVKNLLKELAQREQGR